LFIKKEKKEEREEMEKSCGYLLLSLGDSELVWTSLVNAKRNCCLKNQALRLTACGKGGEGGRDESRKWDEKKSRGAISELLQ
jgi:hypothetical protein